MGVIVDSCRLIFSCICLIKAHPLTRLFCTFWNFRSVDLADSSKLFHTPWLTFVSDKVVQFSGVSCCFFQIRYFVFISFLPHDFIHEGCRIPSITCSVSCNVLVSLEIRGVLLFPGSASRLFLAGGSPSTSDSSSSLDPFEPPSSLPSSGSSSTECEAIKSPRPVKPAFIESLRPSNELLRASARAEPRAAAFKVIFELPPNFWRWDWILI